MKVYQAICNVQADLCKEGIGKDSTNTYDGYKFRGIDAVYNALSPLLAKHGLCVLPRMLSRTVEIHASKKGDGLFYVTVDAEFDFVSAEDGSKHTVKTYGEAMDRSDKGTNKAMSAAYKYAAFQTFAIPTEGDNDTENNTHTIATPAIKHSPIKDAFKNIPQDRQSLITDVVTAIQDRMLADDEIGAYEEYTGIVDSEEKIALWSQLDSKVRSAIKRQSELLKGQKND